MHNLKLPKDLLNLCVSYLTEEEIIYSEGNYNKFSDDDICEIAAKYGWVDLFIWIQNKETTQNRYIPDKRIICIDAALYGHLDIIKWAKKNGTPWYTSEWICSAAAFSGNFDILKWAKNNGCELGAWTCAYAALNGNFEMVKWLI